MILLASIYNLLIQFRVYSFFNFIKKSTNLTLLLISSVSSSHNITVKFRNYGKRETEIP